MAKQSHKAAKRHGTEAPHAAAPAGLRRALVRQQLDEFSENISQITEDLCQLRCLAEKLRPPSQLELRLNQIDTVLNGGAAENNGTNSIAALRRLRQIVESSADPQLAQLVRSDIAHRKQQLDKHLVAPFEHVSKLAKRLTAGLEKLIASDLVEPEQVEILSQCVAALSIEPRAIGRVDIELFSPQLVELLRRNLEIKTDKLIEQIACESEIAQRQQLIEKNPALKALCAIVETGMSEGDREQDIRQLTARFPEQRIRDALAVLTRVLPEHDSTFIERLSQQVLERLRWHNDLRKLGTASVGQTVTDSAIVQYPWEELQRRFELVAEYNFDPIYHVVFERISDLVTRSEPEIRAYFEAFRDYLEELPRDIAPRTMLPERFPENFVSSDILQISAQKLRVLNQRDVSPELEQWESIVERDRSECERLLSFAGINHNEAAIVSQLVYRVIFNWGDYQPFYHKDQLVQRALSSQVISEGEVALLEDIIHKYQRAGFFKPRSIDPALLQFDPEGKESSSPALLRAFKPIGRLHALRGRVAELDRDIKLPRAISDKEARIHLPRLAIYFSFLDLGYSIREFDRLCGHLENYCSAVPLLYGSNAVRKDSADYARALELVERSYSEGFQVNHNYRDDGHKWRADIGMTYCLRVTKYFADDAEQLNRVLNEFESSQPKLIAEFVDMRTRLLEPLLVALGPAKAKAAEAKPEWPDSERGFSEYMHRNLWPALIEATTEMIEYFKSNRENLLQQVEQQQQHLQDLLGIKIYA